MNYGWFYKNGYVAISSSFKLSKNISQILWDVASHLNHIPKLIWGDDIGLHDPIFYLGEY